MSSSPTSLFSAKQKQEKQQTLQLKTKENPSPISSLLLPLNNRYQLALLSHVIANKPLSKSVLVSLNTILVNRDDGLFDNLPWATWSVDPLERNRDAAGNPIDKKYHLGKRDAYNRLLGKDWPGQSLAVGNLALRLKMALEGKENKSSLNWNQNGDGNTDDNAQDESERMLAQRILQLQIREFQMEMAEIESDLAVARRNEPDSVSQLEKKQTIWMEKIIEAQEKLKTLDVNSETSAAQLSTVLTNIAESTTKSGTKAPPPYRGAIGYPPMLDTKEDIEKALSYTSPYDVLKEILEDQLNAKVIGCVLENTSLLEGNLALGGAVILQRITATKTIQLAGETITVTTPEEDFGNLGVQGGETLVVECDGDEAIGVALACDVPLKVESKIYDEASVMVEPAQNSTADSSSIWDMLPTWLPMDRGLSLQVEGEKETGKSTSPIAIPRTTMSLFDSIFERKANSKSPMFPTDSPIKSLQEFDELSDAQKAKTLLEMSNFRARLPRPRVVRMAKTNPLDELLLPLIDESVRRQYLIRDAEQRGDMERVAQLKAAKSRRQTAKEFAETALDQGDKEQAAQWESEAQFLESLRADVTQDEGSYSRFLDRDEWYERERQATAKRVKKSSFGTLLDGIE